MEHVTFFWSRRGDSHKFDDSTNCICCDIMNLLRQVQMVFHASRPPDVNKNWGAHLQKSADSKRLGTDSTVISIGLSKAHAT